MSYVAPLSDIRALLQGVCNLEGIGSLPGFDGLTTDLADAVLTEAAKLSEQSLAPLSRQGDREGVRFSDGVVETPTGWKSGYSEIVSGGWNNPTGHRDRGGMGLPRVLNAAIQEMFHSANTSLALCSMLTQGAIEALGRFGSSAIQSVYLDRLAEGHWTGTMNLTEAQAGSDLGAIATRATADGAAYRIAGQKIFITYGEHDLTENIVHLVLARLLDAPDGVKGISLFVVPKFLVDPTGGVGELNDVRCVSIEHKLGIHGSPTCTMVFGDEGGAVGQLVGEPNRGLEYMFAMMNAARLNVGIQGVAIAERSYQAAVVHARSRHQGRAPGSRSTSALIEHPDVQRMVGTMRAKTLAARSICYMTARSLDLAAEGLDSDERARHQRRADLLIPIAKGWSTEIAVEVTSIGIQVHGGMGFVEETGVAQHFRDARITTIYEGTTGIQALDLVGRKIGKDGGRAALELAADIRQTQRALADLEGMLALAETVGEMAELVEQSVDWLLGDGAADPRFAGAASVNLLHVFGIATGAWLLASASLLSRTSRAELGGPDYAIATFFAEQVCPEGQARLRSALSVKAVLSPLLLA